MNFFYSILNTKKADAVAGSIKDYLRTIFVLSKSVPTFKVTVTNEF